MRTLSVLIGVVLCNPAARAQDEAFGAADGNWPQFRGTDAQGVSDGHTLATEWDLDEWHNIAWDCEIPGLSHSCPIVWEDLVFLVTARPQERGAAVKPAPQASTP